MGRSVGDLGYSSKSQLLGSPVEADDPPNLLSLSSKTDCSDIRSQNDQNTRIIGDFTKMVRLIPIMEKMHTIFSTDEDWRTHFGELLGSSELDFPNQVTTIVAKLERACEWQAKKSRSFRRQSLQCRFFETGDQFYLGESNMF